MTIYDHIKTYNSEEVRQASGYMDRLADERRRNQFAKFIGGLFCMAVWSGFVAFVLWGWLS